MEPLEIKKPPVTAGGSKTDGVKSNIVSSVIITQSVAYPSTTLQEVLNSKRVEDLKKHLTSLGLINGLVSITCITPNNEKPIEHRTFNIQNGSAECIEYIFARNYAGFNVYFTVNQLVAAVNKKPSKVDIQNVTIAHVDIDPDPNNLEASKQKLNDNVPSLIEEYNPTWIIWSGNGLQLFWFHKMPLSIEAGEAINRSLVVQFSGDKGTHNADRLMRVPGTLNYASKTKLLKGYSPDPVETKLLYFNDLATYDASLFPVPLEIVSAPQVISTNAPLITGLAPDVLRKAWDHFLSKKVGLQAFWQYQIIPSEGHSEIFQSLLNHMVFYAQGNEELMLKWLLKSPLAQSEWFKKRYARSDGIVKTEMGKAIKSQQAFYDPNYSTINQESSDLSHSDLAVELGERFFYQNTRYIAKFNSWFVWDGVRWVRDEKCRHLSLISDFLRTKAQELLARGETQKGSMSDADHDKLMKGLRQESKTLKSAPFRMNVENMIKTDPKCVLSPNELDTDLRVIGTPNGIINLITGQSMLPSRAYYITKSTGCELKDGSPDVWLNFLSEIFENDQEMISFIQRLLGYALSGLTVEEMFFFFYGSGANGKSKCLEIFYFLLGDYAKRAPAELLLEQRNSQHPTAMAGLMGARGVFASEIPSGKTWNEQVIKDLTGGDTITARYMRQDFFEFRPHLKLLIAGNHQPRLKNVDESVVRRMVMIPFNVTIPPEQRDTQLGEKLKAEAGQILGWCVEGAVEYFKNGLQIPESVTSASKDYIKNEDVIGEFIDTNTERAAANCEVRIIFNLYKDWISSQGYNYPITERQLRKEFKDRGYGVKRSNSVYYIHNIRRKFQNQAG